MILDEEDFNEVTLDVMSTSNYYVNDNTYPITSVDCGDNSITITQKQMEEFCERQNERNFEIQKQIESLYFSISEVFRPKEDNNKDIFIDELS